MTTDELRAKFEAWWKEMYAFYVSDKLVSLKDYAWAGYQAAHASRDAEVEALRKDAERYRWLREMDGGAIYAITGDVDGIHPEQLDTAIDAAMREESK